MSRLIEAARIASAKLASIIDRVCGACGNSCCHQGTMMGSQDLLRLHKGLLLEEGRERTLREGLKRRAGELRTDLAALERAAVRLAEDGSFDSRAQLDKLNRHLGAWREVCDFLESDFALTRENLHYLLRFAGIRANALRIVGALPGGPEALVDPGSPGASFRVTRGRIAPPRCLFDMDGCLAGGWKPAKCASFFCTTEPNVLRAIAESMSFEQFVLANFRPAAKLQVLRAIELELALSASEPAEEVRGYLAPKIIVGASEQLVSQVQAALETRFGLVEVKREDAAFMLSSHEAYLLLDHLPTGMAYMRVSRGADGGALYELAVALDRLRIEGRALPFYLFLSTLNPPTELTHPLWADSIMSQPLGAVDLYAVE